MDIPDLPICDDLWGRFYLDYYEKGTPTHFIRRDDDSLVDLSTANYFRTELSELEASALERRLQRHRAWASR